MYIRYFFIVDKVQIKEVKVIYCLTNKILADFSSKPTQDLIF